MSSAQFSTLSEHGRLILGSGTAVVGGSPTRVRNSSKISLEVLGSITAAKNYADTLVNLKHFEESKSLMLKMIPVARRALGEGHRLTLKMRLNYAQTLFADTAATLDDLREAVSTLEDTTRTAWQVFGGAHPLTESIEGALQNARAALRAREAPSTSA